MTLKHLIPLIERDGLLPTVRAFNPVDYATLVSIITEHGPIKGLTAYPDPRGDHFLSGGGDYLGEYMYGPLADNTTIGVSFRMAGPWVRTNHMVIELYRFDPRQCDYPESCTCDDEGTCSYCEDGSDYCVHHGDYH